MSALANYKVWNQGELLGLGQGDIVGGSVADWVSNIPSKYFIVVAECNKAHIEIVKAELMSNRDWWASGKYWNLLEDSEKTLFEKWNAKGYRNKKMYCTAKNGAFVCKIAALNRFGKQYYKMPKLIVLYTTLFGKEDMLDITKLHNALYDVVICLRCFIKMRYDIDIYGKNTKITSLFDNIIIRTK
jgi:hypothetical protein